MKDQKSSRPSKPKRPTLFDVAREAGVGATTVSRVIDGGHYVDAETSRLRERPSNTSSNTAAVASSASVAIAICTPPWEYRTELRHRTGRASAQPPQAHALVRQQRSRISLYAFLGGQSEKGRLQIWKNYLTEFSGIPPRVVARLNPRSRIGQARRAPTTRRPPTPSSPATRTTGASSTAANPSPTTTTITTASTPSRAFSLSRSYAPSFTGDPHSSAPALAAPPIGPRILGCHRTLFGSLAALWRHLRAHLTRTLCPSARHLHRGWRRRPHRRSEQQRRRDHIRQRSFDTLRVDSAGAWKSMLGHVRITFASATSRRCPCVYGTVGSWSP